MTVQRLPSASAVRRILLRCNRPASGLRGGSRVELGKVPDHLLACGCLVVDDLAVRDVNDQDASVEHAELDELGGTDPGHRAGSQYGENDRQQALMHG